MSEADQAVLIQKQARDNAEDLRNEMLDLSSWQEQMNKKDAEIRNSDQLQVTIPPVRKKKKTTENNNSTVIKPQDKTKRISSWDYSSWDKFDADKACKEVNENSNTKEGLIEEVPSKAELEKLHAKAIKLKEEGNILVQKKEWSKAVGCYTEAIKIFPHDATFYANRALCQLKLDNLHIAEADCTLAINLDELYIKAYHRRATARYELKRYSDAKKDLDVILVLEPNNKDAKRLLLQIKNITDKNPPLIISGNETVSSPLTKKICKTGKEDSTEVTNKKKFRQNKHELLPLWLPKLKSNITVVEPLKENFSTTNHVLKRIAVEEISRNESIFQDVAEILTENQTNQSSATSVDTAKSKKDVKVNEKLEDINVQHYGNDKSSTFHQLPPVPKTSVSFLLNWKKFTSTEHRYLYLKQIDPANIPDIFKEAMESDTFSQILIILKEKFIKNKDKVYDYIDNICKVKRFRALLLFMSSQDKKVLQELFQYCKEEEAKTDEQIKRLSSIYEV